MSVKRAAPLLEVVAVAADSVVAEFPTALAVAPV